MSRKLLTFLFLIFIQKTLKAKRKIQKTHKIQNHHKHQKDYFYPNLERYLNGALLKLALKPPLVVTALTPQVINPNLEVNTFGDIQTSDTSTPPVVEEVDDKFVGGAASLPFI